MDWIRDFYHRHRTVILLSGSTCMFLLGFLLLKKKLGLAPLNQFLEQLEKGRVSEVVVKGSKLVFKQGQNWFKTTSSQSSESLIQLFTRQKGLKFSFQQEQTPFKVLNVLGATAMSILAFKLLYNQFFKDSASYKPNFEKVKFQDIKGNARAKKALMEVIHCLNNQKQLLKLGARNRKGIVLYGPPGTGKTMLAKAFATQCSANFIYSSASNLIELYIGSGPKKIKQLFNNARKKVPAVIFIDQLDAIGRRSDQNLIQNQRNSTINQLLIQMDGFQKNHSIFVIAATNKIQNIDPAVLRAGRFDLKIQIFLPNQEERFDLLKSLVQRVKHSTNEEEIVSLSQMTQGLSGADIQLLVNESSLSMLTEGKQSVSYSMLQNSLRSNFKK